jgi:hypothetical protein
VDIYRWITPAHNLWRSSYILLPVSPGSPIYFFYWGMDEGVSEAQ